MGGSRLQWLAATALLVGCGSSDVKARHDPTALLTTATLDALRYRAETGLPQVDDLIRELSATLCELQGHRVAELARMEVGQLWRLDRAAAASTVTCGTLVFADGTTASTDFWKPVLRAR